MVTMKSIFCTAALLIFVGIISIQRAEAQCGGFGSTCSGFAIAASGVFTATCNDASGKPTSASISLDSYISNIDGEMFVPGAGFSNSCSDLTWSGSDTGGPEVYILGACNQRDGTDSIGTYDIDSHVSNDNGILHWHQC